MGFTDGKNVSRTIRTGFMDIFSVSHSTLKPYGKMLCHGKNLYEGPFAWLLLYTLLAIQCENINFWNFYIDTVYV